jgi:hypothetical protein
MDIDLHSIEEKIASHVAQMYEDSDVPHYPYHNLEHTRGVVTHCGQLAAYYSLGKRDAFVLQAAGWFHDIGHLFGTIEGHEERGVVLMKQYLSNIPGELTTSIAAGIRATRLPSQPNTPVEMMICDADTWHLGTVQFRQTDPLVRKELELRKGSAIDDWNIRTLAMLRRHEFFTEYCRTMLARGKEENIAWVESRAR